MSKKNVVFMLAVKVPQYPWRSEPYKYGIASWKKWCEKNDCELFVLEDLIHDNDYMKINWQRYYVFDLLEQQGIDYDQILVIDVDNIVHPDTPNFFEISDRKFCATHTDGSYDWTFRSMENYSKHLFNGQMFPFWKYINAGFQIINESHRQFYQDLVKFYFENRDKIIWCQENLHVGTDQPVLNFMLNLSDIETKLLPYQYSMVDMVRKEILDEDMTFTKCGWVYQFNAIPDNKYADKTMYWMKKTYEYFHGELND